MQSEKFDNKIREAAGHHQPAYDEKAWGKMEKLLNKYLPQEKDDRRRFILFFLLFLLLGGSAFVLISKPWQKNKSIATVIQKAPPPIIIQPSTASPSDKNKKSTGELGKINQSQPANKNPNNPTISSKAITKEDQPVAETEFITKKKGVNTFISSSRYKKINNKIGTIFSATSDSKQRQDNGSLQIDNLEKKSESNIKIISANTDVTDISSNNINKPIINKEIAKSDSTQKGIKEPVNDESVKTTNDVVTKPPADKNKKNKKNNSFYFTLSAGPDISFAGSDKFGKAKLLTGAGAGYTFNGRFTVRTGIYTGRKIYSASPDEYHPPAGFWAYYTYLQKVAADCKIIEIPLSVSYNFGKSSKQNWFISTGLSSYLMKKESYKYYYKQTPTGQTLTGNWAIENKNKHYFSILTLSGGYQRSISKYISIMVEPYLKLPLSGIGYGKVKLNSGGLLFSVGIKPFAKAKKK